MAQSFDSSDSSGLSTPESRGARLWRQAVRDGDWLTWDRIGFACACTAISLVAVVFYFVSISELIVSSKGIFVADYLSFWFSGKQVLLGSPELAYDFDAFARLQTEFSGSDTVFAFFYPPTYQLALPPFSALSYHFAFLMFIALTTAMLWLALKLAMRNSIWAFCLLLLPANIFNAMSGQNSALVAALFGLFLVFLSRNKPVAAGIALGLMTIKPQLGALIPLALIAGGYWRTFFAASATTVLLAALALVLLGPDVWVAFWQQIPVASATLEGGAVDWDKMASVYSALRLFGISHEVGLLVQVTIALGALLSVCFTWRRTTCMAARASVLTAGCLLTTPFCLSYDLTLLTVPLAFLIAHGIREGFLPYEKISLAMVVLLSAPATPLAPSLGVPIGPVLPLLILTLGLYRTRGCEPNRTHLPVGEARA
ncbi:hypothetical protein A3843_15740 [Pseudovibrio exalbescens]|uniref:DUF2029 domain-containing protein n=1 Tax=Pseudovibrio exalbescens TaxID=197461 RepID=A0A1U7JEQ5_9HYPH|nr:hypothetical protein A3843_15740 [Pseudovibrio exalbescens]